MKKKRKLLSLLVAFLFMFTLIPTSVYAEGSDTETKAKDEQQTLETIAPLQATITSTEYVLDKDGVDNGAEYLIVAKDNNGAYALTNNDGTIGATNVTVSGDKATVTGSDTNMLWTLNGSGSSYTVQNEIKYLYMRAQYKNVDLFVWEWIYNFGLNDSSSSLNVNNKNNGSYVISKSFSSWPHNTTMYLTYNSGFTYSTLESTVQLYKKVTKETRTLTVHYFVNDQENTAWKYEQQFTNVITGSDQNVNIVKPADITKDNGYGFVNMTVDDGESSEPKTYDTETYNVIMKGDTVVNYYYNKYEIKNVKAYFYTNNVQVEDVCETTVKATPGSTEPVTVHIDKPASITNEYGFDYMTINDKPNYTELFDVPVNEDIVVKYYYATPSEEGIRLSKTATRKPDDATGIGKYDIQLGVKGLEVKQGTPTDIVVVIDMSSSMSDGNRIGITTTAISNFIDKVLSQDVQSTNIRLAFATYTSSAQAYKFSSYGGSYTDTLGNNTDTFFTGSDKKAKDALNLTVKNYQQTNSKSGFDMAYNLLNKRSDQSRKSIVIFMTDGVPTSPTGGGLANETDYNNAVDAEKTLYELNNNTIYTVGLLTGYSSDSLELKIANKLLSDTEVTKAKKITADYDSEKVVKADFYEGVAPGYSKKYYKVTSEDSDVASTMNEIYQEIALKALTLTKNGTVVDTLPAEFELAPGEKEKLEKAGAIVEVVDGITTITFTDVNAGKELTNLPVFTVQEKTDAYGAVFTNEDATYTYTLYNEADGVTHTKHFPKPVGLINPKAADDKYFTSVNSEHSATTNIMLNDPSYGKVLTDSAETPDDEKTNYTVENLNMQLMLKNEDGTYSEINPENEGFAEKYPFIKSVDRANGIVTFDNSKEGTYTFYYVDKAFAEKASGSNDPGENNDATLVSNVATVTIHVYGPNDKTFVVDYGKPVTYNKDVAFDGLFEKDDLGAAINMEGADADGKSTNADAYGTMEFNSTDKSLTYRLTKFMEGIDTFTFNESKNNPCWNVKLTKTVTMIPATAIYYEDNFGGTSVINYSSNWKIFSNDDAQIGAPQDSDQNENYGYDSGYADDTKYSDGSVHYIEVPANAKTPETASFTFKGTGFDIISRTKADTRTIYYSVKDMRDEEALPYGAWLDNYYSGDLYQIPVISCDMGKWSEYEVTIKVYPGYKFYLDGIRIYNPLGTAVATSSSSGEGTAPAEGVIPTIAADRYKADKEFNPYVKEIRNMLLDASNLNIADSTYEGGVFVDGNGNAQYETYKNAGPNNEVYLKAGQAVAFRIITDELPGSVQIGLKVPDAADNSATPIITDGNGNNYGLDLDENNKNQGKLVKDKTGELKTSSEMNYEIKMVNDNKENILFTKTEDNKYTATVVIKNNTGSTGILSVTKLKLTAGESGNTPSVSIVSDKNVDAAVKLAFAKPQSEPEEPQPSEPEQDSFWDWLIGIIGGWFRP